MFKFWQHDDLDNNIDIRAMATPLHFLSKQPIYKLSQIKFPNKRQTHRLQNYRNDSLLCSLFINTQNFTKLTHYNTMPHFDGLKTYSCGKHGDKRRNCLLQAISPFLTMFSTLYGTYFSF